MSDLYFLYVNTYEEGLDVGKFEYIAYKILELLLEYDCSTDVVFYFEGKRLIETDKDWVIEEGYLGSDYTEYANDDTLTMTFEGPFFEVMNYGTNYELYDKFDKLLQSFGYYYELGNAWNLALYEI